MARKKVRKAIFPVAGLGTRFLPATKSIPKEMLTVVDRPIIQHVADEAREAGIEHFVFVTGRNKSSIEDHFDKQYELEHVLELRQKDAALEKLRQYLPQPGQISFTRQQEPLGLGHAIWCARELIGDEPFAVILPDMIVDSQVGCLSQMVADFERMEAGNLIAVEEVDPSLTHKYGVVDVQANLEKRLMPVSNMIEKPIQGTAPSNFIISGRYILQPEIFDYLSKNETDASGEIQLTDSMARMLKSQSFYASKFEGKVYDCGSKFGYLAANLTFGLRDAEVGDEFKRFAKNLLDTI